MPKITAVPLAHPLSVSFSGISITIKLYFFKTACRYHASAPPRKYNKNPAHNSRSHVRGVLGLGSVLTTKPA